MATFHGKRVSGTWSIILNAAEDDGVDIDLNSGQRTMGEQAVLRRLYLSGDGNLAAVPSCGAPHIRCGREDHALDIDQLTGSVYKFERWVRRHGEALAWTVSGEPWHVEIVGGEKALRRLAAKVKDGKYDHLAADERGWVGKLFHHRIEMGRYDGAKTARGKVLYAKNLGWARYFKALLRARANLLYARGKARGWAYRNGGARQRTIRAIVDNPKRRS